MSKYGNIKTIYNGHVFDSRMEATRYQELLLLEKAGQISNIELQPKFTIQPAYKKNGRSVAPIYYIADFAYTFNLNGQRIVEDVKGCKTKEYRLKKKLVEYKYPEVTIAEV